MTMNLIFDSGKFHVSKPLILEYKHFLRLTCCVRFFDARRIPVLDRENLLLLRLRVATSRVFMGWRNFDLDVETRQTRFPEPLVLTRLATRFLRPQVLPRDRWH